MRKFHRVAIVGRGIIGSSWALVFARAGLEVRIWCRDDKSGHQTISSIADMIRSVEGTGLCGDEATLARITAHVSFEDCLEGADYVQESVLEALDIKHDVLQKIERLANAEAIVASSTSGILPSDLARVLSRPEQFLVVHPLTPPHLLPIAELCPAARTAPDTITAAFELMRKVGQHPVLIHSEVPGFVLNRILAALMNELFALMREGIIAPDDVDATLTEGFGLRWSVIGPLASMDLNAPGGIREYLSRYGQIFKTVATSRGMASPLDDTLIEKIAVALQGKSAGTEPAHRAAARDRAIAEMRRHRSHISDGPSLG